MKTKISKKIISFIIVVVILGVAGLMFMNPFKNDQPFSIIDVMEEELNLQTGEVKIVILKKPSAEPEENNIVLTDTDTEKIITYLDSTILEKSKKNIESIDSVVYLINLHTDENAVDYEGTKKLILKNNSGKTYIQLIGADKGITYETDDNGLYNLVVDYLK